MLVGALPRGPIYHSLLLVGVLLSNVTVVIAVVYLGAEGMYWGHAVAGVNSFLLGPRFGLIYSIVLGISVFLAALLWAAPSELISFGASFAMLVLFVYIFSHSVHKQRDKLKHLTLTDPLTGVGNRRSMDVALQQEIDRVHRQGISSSLIAIDLDHFKKINDTDGHDMGDRFLVNFTNMLKQRARRTDIIFRTGGDEFLIIAPATTADHALELAEDLRVETLEIELAGTTGCSMSAGISELQADETADVWLKHTDSALYQAKVRGRNQVVVYRPSDD
jgi:diguanylate cyclase (GGDEF)-like protein